MVVVVVEAMIVVVIVVVAVAVVVVFRGMLSGCCERDTKKDMQASWAA